ncbi:MAG: 2-oxoacid:ferredoxin oxidoreductase subunit beta [Planctomycetes bacterium]|nr:2-oxoacid:ferredoxin oxidoreductase subunit beta [Planctomycetota bacterium]
MTDSASSSAHVKDKKDYRSDIDVTWCPGCGDFGVLDAVSRAFATLGLPQEKLVLVSGIGCSSRFPYFTKSYSFHTLHGRLLPSAMGIAIANPDLIVIGTGGDGDAYSIGGGHFIHACRRNPNLKYIVMDNQIYGLTKGQYSPTSDLGFVTGSTPYGSCEDPIDPISMALVFGASFVARGFSSKPKECEQLIIEAINHKGFAFLDIFSPCPTFNKVNSVKYYMQKIKPLPETHNVEDKASALTYAQDQASLFVGVFYKKERPTMQEKLADIRQKASMKPIKMEDLYSLHT